MSVKNEYYSFIRRERSLRRRLERKKVRFEKIEKLYLELLAKQVALKKCYAQITTEALETISRRVEKVRVPYYEAKKEYEDLLMELENCIKGRESLEEPSKYIEEQARMMVEKLRKFVDENQQQLAINVKSGIAFRYKTRTISIPCENPLNNMEYDIEYYAVPNGIIEIRCGARVIATSKDFFFQRKMYYVEPIIIKDCNTNEVYRTAWFKEFIERFYSALQNNIEEAFRENPNFCVKFTDKAHFTIELR